MKGLLSFLAQDAMGPDPSKDHRIAGKFEVN